TLFSLLHGSSISAQPADEVIGLVVSIDGTPIPGAKGMATPEGTIETGRPSVSVLTDSSEQNRFEGLPSGNYIITAGIEGTITTSLQGGLSASISVFNDNFFLVRSKGGIVDPMPGQTRIVTDVTLLGPARIVIPGPNADLTIVVVKSL